MTQPTKKNVFSLAVLALVLATCSFYGEPSGAAAGKDEPSSVDAKQPIAFSHKLHSQQQIDCATCHENPDPGENITIPTADFCMTCHQAVAVESPGIKQLAESAKEKKTIPWVRVNSLPAFVFWSHRTHLAAGQQCTACHGQVADMDVIRASKLTTMDACVDCHDKKGANTGCAACHESRTS
jgi:hypothetical protein